MAQVTFLHGSFESQRPGSAHRLISSPEGSRSWSENLPLEFLTARRIEPTREPTSNDSDPMQFRRSPFANDHPLVFNIVSFIDILLVLLAYMIMTWSLSSASESTTDIELPTASSDPKKPAKPPLLIVNISRSGELSVNKETLTQEELIKKLLQLEKLAGKQAVVIRGDKGVPYETTSYPSWKLATPRESLRSALHQRLLNPGPSDVFKPVG